MDETKRGKGLFARMAAAADGVADSIDSTIPKWSDTSQQRGPAMSLQDDINLLGVNVTKLFTIAEQRDRIDQSLGRRIREVEVQLEKSDENITRLFDHYNALRDFVGELTARVATLEARLKTFEALERLGIASQLGEETIARTDELVTTLEHEMQEKIDQLRANQRRALEGMRDEMDQYRANMAKLAK